MILKVFYESKNFKFHRVLLNLKLNGVVYYDNNFILGKSNQKSEIFDILVFARRDIVNAIIPSFIKQIGPYSFTYCTRTKQPDTEIPFLLSYIPDTQTIF